MKNIGIIGFGWLGSRLAVHLNADNTIYATTTSEIKTSELISRGFACTTVHFSDQEDSGSTEKWVNLQMLDVIIITVPFPKRGHLSEILHRAKNLQKFIEGYDKQLFLISSTGVYPQIDADISENTFPDSALEQNIFQSEHLLKTHFPQLNILRCGGLMGDDRILSRYKVQPTDQIVNHVHFEDICLIIEKMIHANVCAKTYNVVAPVHPTKAEVLNFQSGLPPPTPVTENVPCRKISTQLLVREMKYEYKYPDPKLI